MTKFPVSEAVEYRDATDSPFVERDRTNVAESTAVRLLLASVPGTAPQLISPLDFLAKFAAQSNTVNMVFGLPVGAGGGTKDVEPVQGDLNTYLGSTYVHSANDLVLRTYADDATRFELWRSNATDWGTTPLIATNFGLKTPSFFRITNRTDSRQIAPQTAELNAAVTGGNYVPVKGNKILIIKPNREIEYWEDDGDGDFGISPIHVDFKQPYHPPLISITEANVDSTAAQMNVGNRFHLEIDNEYQGIVTIAFQGGENVFTASQSTITGF